MSAREEVERLIEAVQDGREAEWLAAYEAQVRADERRRLLAEVKRYVETQAYGMLLDGARFGLADALDLVAHLSDHEARP